MRKLILLAGLSVALISCGTDEAAPTTDAPVDTASATTMDHSQHTVSENDGDTATISISGSSFAGPATVSVGDTIEIVNNDAISHTWTAEDDGPFDISLGAGESATYTFEEAGTFAYFCRVHPSMTGTITVEG